MTFQDNEALGFHRKNIKFRARAPSLNLDSHISEPCDCLTELPCCTALLLSIVIALS